MFHRSGETRAVGSARGGRSTTDGIQRYGMSSRNVRRARMDGKVSSSGVNLVKVEVEEGFAMK